MVLHKLQERNQEKYIQNILIQKYSPTVGTYHSTLPQIQENNVTYSKKVNMYPQCVVTTVTHCKS